MSAYLFENKKSVPVGFLSFHFAYGKMKTVIELLDRVDQSILEQQFRL